MASSLAPRSSLQFPEFRLGDIARLAARYNAIDLAVGSPDFPAPSQVKDAAARAIYEDKNQYDNTWGNIDLRERIAYHYRGMSRNDITAHDHVTITCGATEGLFDLLFAMISPGDEVILFEPFHFPIWSAIKLCGGTPRIVTLHSPGWEYDLSKLRSAFTGRTRALVLNTPHNPTGRVFSASEIETIIGLCQRESVLCISDEVYASLVFDGRAHLSPLSIGNLESVAVLGSLSKTFSVTGWRVGYVIASSVITHTLRKIHDVVTAGAPSPFQAAGVAAMELGDDYHEELRLYLQLRRDEVLDLMCDLDLQCSKPEGGYFMVGRLPEKVSLDSTAYVERLIVEVGVALAPMSAFYSQDDKGRREVRICFAKSQNTLCEVKKRLEKFTSL